MKLKPDKNLGLNGVLCDAGAVLYQLSYQAKKDMKSHYTSCIPQVVYMTAIINCDFLSYIVNIQVMCNLYNTGMLSDCRLKVFFIF